MPAGDGHEVVDRGHRLPAAGVLLGAVAVLLSGCSGGSGAATPSPSATPRVAHSGPIADLLLRLDDLPAAGFTVAAVATPVDRAGAAGGDAALATALGLAHYRDGASTRYFRTVPVLRTAIGPVDVTSTVLRFDGASGAAAALTAVGRHLDAAPGAIATSSGPLADGGHADIQEVTDQAVTVVQATLAWRAGDLVSILVIRERDTGSPLQDALLVARPQVAREQA